jgi:hypothetical protein
MRAGRTILAASAVVLAIGCTRAAAPTPPIQHATATAPIATASPKLAPIELGFAGGATGEITHVAIAIDSAHGATASRDWGIVAWDLEKQAPLWSARAPGAVVELRVTSDRIIALTTNGAAAWSLADGAAIGRVLGDERTVQKATSIMRVSADGRRVALVRDGALHIVDIATNAEEPSIPIGPVAADEVTWVDDDRAVVLTRGAAREAWDVTSRARAWSCARCDGALAATGRRIVRMVNKEAHLLDPTRPGDDHTFAKLPSCDVVYANGSGVNPAGTRAMFVIACDTGPVLEALFELPRLKLLRTWPVGASPSRFDVDGTIVSANGERLTLRAPDDRTTTLDVPDKSLQAATATRAIVAMDSRVALYDVARGSTRHFDGAIGLLPLGDVAFRRDGGGLAAVSGAVGLTSAIAWRWAPPNATAAPAAGPWLWLTPDGESMVNARRMNFVERFSLSADTRERMEPDSLPSGDARLVMIRDQRCHHHEPCMPKLELLDRASGERHVVADNPRGKAILVPKLSEDGRLIAYGTRNSVRVHDAATGALLHEVYATTPQSLALRGPVLAVAAEDLRVWDLRGPTVLFQQSIRFDQISITSDGALLVLSNATKEIVSVIDLAQRVRREVHVPLQLLNRDALIHRDLVAALSGHGLELLDALIPILGRLPDEPIAASIRADLGFIALGDRTDRRVTVERLADHATLRLSMRRFGERQAFVVNDAGDFEADDATLGSLRDRTGGLDAPLTPQILARRTQGMLEAFFTKPK